MTANKHTPDWNVVGPELLEALIRLEAELVEDKYSEDYEPSPFENLAIARAAIANATGGAA